MANLILIIVLTSTCFFATFGANVPTVTITNTRRASTIRFPEDHVEITSTEKVSLLNVLPPNVTSTTTTTEPSTIKPTKPSRNVNIIGNYSVAVQHVSQEDEIIVKATPLLELLNILRQLPNEKLLEIYPKLLGEAENGYGSYQTSTESVLDFLNQIREQPKITPTSSPVTITDSAKNTITKASTIPATARPDVLKTTSSSPDVSTTTTLSPMTSEQTTQSPITRIDLKNTPNHTNEQQSKESVAPIGTTEKIVITTEKAQETSSISYEFTDYPPPLPPSLPEFPSIVKHQDDKGGGASFAIGVAVGIFACVLVASTGVTWCVCRRHWGRRNVYATMERSEEMPRGLTKPGPPIILPSEFESSKKLSTAIAKQEHQNDDGCNRVTEL